MTYPARLVRDDLDAIWSTLLDVGADPFQAADRPSVERAYRDARAAIVSDMNVLEAWLAIAPVLGALNDGHVSLGFPDSLDAARRRFPLRFSLADADDALLVARDTSKTIDAGSRVVSVEGISADTYRTTALAANGGQTRTLHRAKVTTAGAWVSIALFGDKPDYAVTWIAPDGTSHDARVPASASTGPAGGPAPKGSDPYTYRTLRDGAAGYIDYRRCEDHARFLQFLDTTLTAIKAAPVRALIVDIRRNGGGDSSLNDELWVNCSTKAFKQFGGVVIKACDRLKHEYGHDKYVRIYGQQAWDAPNGTMFNKAFSPTENLFVHPPGDDPTWYKGPVYVLIGPDTFSSAMTCALAAKDYGLATIVGEETGEPVLSTGEVYALTTPNLGLRAYLTTKVFLPPKSHPPRQGVVPDFVVPTTLADSAAGRDPVLDFVLARI